MSQIMTPGGRPRDSYVKSACSRHWVNKPSDFFCANGLMVGCVLMDANSDIFKIEEPEPKMSKGTFSEFPRKSSLVTTVEPKGEIFLGKHRISQGG